MSLVFQLETVDQCWNEFLVLAKLHWEGTKSYRRHDGFNLSYERYAQCNQSGFFQFIIARDGPRMAGYFGFYLTQSMHSQKPILVEDLFFLHPDYRGGRNALRYMQHIEQWALGHGVQEILCSCEAENMSGIHKLLTHLDFAPVIMQYSKTIASPSADSAQPDLNEAEHVRTGATA